MSFFRSLAQRFLGACALLLLGALMIWIAVQLLSQVWGWVFLIAAVILAGYIAIRIIRWRTDRW